MDAQTTAAEPQHPYPPSPWATTSTSSATATATASPPTQIPTTAQSPTAYDGSHILDAATTNAAPHFQAAPFDFLPYLFPQQSNIYQAQLLHYNRLISPARGGGLQTPPLPPVVSSSHAQSATRPRSASKTSLKDVSTGKGNTGGGHGGRSHQNAEKSRSAIASKEVSAKMPPKQAVEQPKALPRRAAGSSTQSQAQSHSSSVPSTPHQHARQFSFEDREPSPTATNNHSPRSAYSETSTLPSLRPLPPRLGGCKYETAQINSRRRIPYSVGNDRLEKLDLRTVKGKLTEEEERKLASDMRDVYDRLLPTEKVEQNRQKLVSKLENIFNDEWPGHDIKVNLFGSSGNLLCSDDSDVDICITTTLHDLEGVCMIADLLARRGMEKVVCISAAKVPIVKIWDPELGLACDMNVNNTLALENTRMVRTYVEADPRVRQLAMIIKYWTRRRIVNDAAFGGTLSSYTWICLIIAFLQLRNHAVLPALHQSPHKLTKSDGTTSDFADDLKKLSGYGSKNKSTVAELLFQFFRFYAHEFDYDKHVLSVRLGKLLTKTEKKWHYAINNQLCVEEPFNTSRNLGNTADDYSFRGLHKELRRAFDLISVGNFEEACEQYVFPKEEERVWSRPPQSRPVLLRSASQTHSGRGGRGNHRGGRHNNNNNNNFHRGNNPNRRASSSVPTYDANNVYIQPVGIPQDMQWYQNALFPFQYSQQDLMAHMAMHQENLRLHGLYAQPSPAYLQHQAMGQGQRLSTSSATSGQQSSDRSRTNSFDNPPLSAPLRDAYAVYPLALGTPFFPQAGAGYGTYPSSPATANGASQDFRRPLQRTVGTNETGITASGSTLRSHSQPASRSPSVAQPASGYFGSQQQVNGVSGAASRQANGTAVPNFISDDGDFDETPKAHPDSPQSEEGKLANFNVTESPSPNKQPFSKATTNGFAFGDLASPLANNASGPGRRRLSTDQLPQTILDRRMRRTSRSPSPLGHTRTFSTGTSPASTSTPQFPGSQNTNLSRPLVVNGSGLKTSMTVGLKQHSEPDSNTSEGSVAASTDSSPHPSTDATCDFATGGPVVPPITTNVPFPRTFPDPGPIVVNGSNAPMVAPSAPEDASFRDRIEMLRYMNTPHILQEPVSAGPRLSPMTRQRLMSRQPQEQNRVIAPLDLAISEPRLSKKGGVESAHLSPVYESRIPSPTMIRKQDGFMVQENQGVQANASVNWGEFTTTGTKLFERPVEMATSPTSERPQKPAPQAQRVNGSRENGHVQRAKSESDGGWQRAGKGKKKGANGVGNQNHAEQLPRNESERKGG